MSIERRTVLFPLFALLLTACSAAPETSVTNETRGRETKDATSEPINSNDSEAPSLIETIGATCTDPAAARGCVAGNMNAGDYYDIEINPRCDATGFHAGVTSGKAVLLDVLPVTGSKARTIADLAEGQSLCVQAIARSGPAPAYYYVAAVSKSSIPGCNKSPKCAQLTELSDVPQSANVACTVDAQGVPQGGCPRGWIDQAAVEAFSDGL